MSQVSDRLDQLAKRMGLADGRLSGSVTVDQLYAHFQHEHPEFHHPRGGKAFYLQAPLFERYRHYLDDVARTMLDDGGREAMGRAMEDLSAQVEVHAPREWGDLHRSGHPQVHLGQRTVYDRAPHAVRVPAEVLRARSRALLRARWNAGLDVFWTAHGRVVHVPASRKRRPW